MWAKWVLDGRSCAIESAHDVPECPLGAPIERTKTGIRFPAPPLRSPGHPGAFFFSDAWARNPGVQRILAVVRALRDVARAARGVSKAELARRLSVKPEIIRRLRRWLGLLRAGRALRRSHAMGLLTFGLNVTLDGCIDHTQGIVDDELHDYWTQLMDQSGAMLFGRNTYELMEGAWPAVARDEKAPRAMREWARKLEAKAKYVVSGSRSDFPWQNTIKVEGDLREAISALKARTERGVLVGAPRLAAALEELGLIDEYRLVVHPIISGRGPTLFHGLSSARQLELLSTQRFESGVQALHFRRKAG